MDLNTFQDLPTTKVAQLVRDAGTRVCGFPVNGSRRWFVIEYSGQALAEEPEGFLEASTRRLFDLCRMVFKHGVDTLIVPVLSLDHTKRRNYVQQIASPGLARIATCREHLDFYRDCGVRVRFYGDYHKIFSSTPSAHLCDDFEEVMVHTQNYDQHRLFFGVLAHDPVEKLAELAVNYYVEQGRSPDKRALVELYYGEYVPPVSLFINFSKFRVFDMPLLVTGTTDLYFSVAPVPYLTEHQLRSILYDHLYARRGDPDYQSLSSDDLEYMQGFYQANTERTLGVGARRKGVWYPSPQVELPPDIAEGDQ